jgi:hypothetical protein
MWAGGLLVGVGGVLAIFPGRRRRATDPVSGRAAAESTGEGPPEPEGGQDEADAERPSVGVGTAGP